jgi:hypothetical protein
MGPPTSSPAVAPLKKQKKQKKQKKKNKKTKKQKNKKKQNKTKKNKKNLNTNHEKKPSWTCIEKGSSDGGKESVRRSAVRC